VPVPDGKASTKPQVADDEPEKPPAAGPGTFKFADGDEPKKPAAKGGKPVPPPAPPPAAAKPAIDDDDEDPESVKKGYGVIGDTEAELEEAEKNKVKFGAVQDKYRKSARGPAIALLVMPSNLLIFEGVATAIGGLLMFVIGMWPLVFNDAPPGDEETEEAIVMMLLGIMTLFWGGFICFGASQMQELGSYLWAMAGAVAGIVPLLVGIYAIIMLQNPKVKAGFAEGALLDEDEEEEEGKKDEDDEDEGDEDEDEDEDDDDDDDDDGGSAKKKAAKPKKLARKGGRDEDEDDE
jgi:hypothetical protein